jgi:putative tryptophan/tyrosine transport system substrate-binding protein
MGERRVAGGRRAAILAADMAGYTRAPIGRRDFIGAAISLALFPIVANAQRALPLVGLLLPGSPTDSQQYAAACIRGLEEAGYVQSETVAIDVRWAEGRYELLPQFASDLVARRVSVLAVGGPPATLAAKAATSTIPIVAVLGDAATLLRLAGSLSRPQGNLTGVAPFITAAIWGKRLELLREVMPKARVVAVLTNPNDQSNPHLEDIDPEARSLGLKLISVTASTDAEIETALSAVVQERCDALLVSDQPFFTVRHDQIVALANHNSLPAIYAWREYPAAGGLVSYGSKLSDAWHQVGAYVGKILKGALPSDLPIVQPTTLELVINLKTAKALGLAVPPSVLARADEVIE